MKTKIESISAIAELERVGWKFETVGGNEVRILCPVHKDNTPSVALNVGSNLWICHACKAKGDIIALLAHITGVERGTIIVDLSTRYDLEEVKVINPSVVEKFHEELHRAGPLLQALRDRGLTDEMMRKARLGFHDGRITIPVFDFEGNCVNIRRYLPGAPGPQKMQNTRGYGEHRIFQAEQIKQFDKLWFCGGEMKAIVTKELLNPYKIGAFSVTASEGTWDLRWQQLVAGKTVFICMDTDNAGRAATRKLALQLRRVCNVFVIKLPLDKEKYPKGDVNDYVGREHAIATDLLRLQDEAVEFAIEETTEDVSEAISLPLAKATSPVHIGRRVSFEGVAVAIDTNPFLVPKQVNLTCDQKQPGCSLCPIFGRDVDPDLGYIQLDIPKTSIGILELVNNPLSRHNDAFRLAFGIPQCRSVAFQGRGHYRVFDLRLTPQISIKHESTENVVYPALVVDFDLDMNTPYIMEAVAHPHPKNQQAVLLVDQVSQSADNLVNFELTEPLDQFRPKSDTVTAIQEKLDDIYTDLEANVTRIFRRRDLLTLFDLTYYAPVMLSFEGTLTPGWVNSIVVGDSGQGKSETANRLIEHYGVGERVECKNASVAGLLGGLQQIGTRWFVTWGVIPTHDRRLVCLEEVKGTSVDVIGKLTDMRSRGIAEIPKIERRRAHARTRLVWISNPRSNRGVSAFNFGIESIRELIGNLEDIRRFDIALIMSNKEVDISVINQLMTERPKVQHKYDSEACRKLVLYAWTRKVEDVVFTDDAIRETLTQTVRLCGKFSETIPLIDRGTMRFKLARLSAALACRLFSVSEERVIVKQAHVEYVAQFIDRVYSSSVFGYLDYTQAIDSTDKVIDPQIVRKKILGMKYPLDLIRQLIYRDDITLPDMMDWCEVDKDDAQSFISFLVRKHCINREKLCYYKTAEFIKFLKALEKEDIRGPSTEGSKF